CSASSDHISFVNLNFHFPGDKNYCDGSVEGPGIQTQDAIPHYSHLNAFHPRMTVCRMGIFFLADLRKYICIG
ncbi:3993_t:CDS:1, partial [Funneliformis geosporum]